MKNVISLTKAARYWDDGLPLGNGRIGAMVMGKVNEETIFINEETLWYGPNRNRKNPDAKINLDKVRKLLLNGEIEKAQFLAKMALTSTPKYVNPYQPAGDLRICILNHKEKTTNYLRSLNIDDAIASVEYKMLGVFYKRELFVSHKYQILAIKITSSQEKQLTLSVNMSRKPFEENTGKLDQQTVGNWGQCGAEGVHYFTGVRMDSFDGTVSTMGDFAYVTDASEVYIYLSTETDFNEKEADKKRYQELCIARLDLAQKRGYEKIKEAHLEEYHQLYDRVTLSVNDCEMVSQPTDTLLEQFRINSTQHPDYLVSLLFNYAKYLMISSSNDCVLPANLQGIWNGSYDPPWQSEFTININLEMNYWMTEKCNLTECNKPLFDLIERLVGNGKRTAKEQYGCRGFCAHHNTNIWANTDPEGIFDASPIWPMGGAWLSLHLYEHYLYSEDQLFLKEKALPVMREAIRFFEDYLFDNENGELITGPSLSPENTYISKIGIKGSLCMGPALDIQILRQLFTWFIEGCTIIGGDYLYVGDGNIGMESVESMLDRLPTTKISSNGRVLEWQEEYEEVEPGHRHISHLYGLHPGNEIIEEVPELFHAAANTLEYRIAHGGGHTGWSRAWITCFYARLKNGQKVLASIEDFLKQSVKDNFLCTHPPFQIDGNFGIAEAILESIVQSHAGYIELLPALPKEWEKGNLRGVCLRGGVKADITWCEGKLDTCFLTVLQKKTVNLKYKEKRIQVLLNPNMKNQILF